MGKHGGCARVERDYYPTPDWVTEALAERIKLAGLRVWEPACGDGRMAEALKAAGAVVHATDIEDRSYSKFAGKLDFLSVMNGKLPFDYNAIITNPPYGARNKLAEKFVEVGLQRVAAGGLLALLLPNDFDSALTRRHLFADCRDFTGKIVLTKRIVWFEPPSGERAGPKENHSWFIWQRPYSYALPWIFYAPQHNGGGAVRTQTHGWFTQQRRREAESDDTVMRRAFINALVKFVARGEFSANGVVLPTGIVSGSDLSQVICALLREQSRSRQ